MADYNIYIHAIGTGSQAAFNPTTPWSQKEGPQGLNQTESWGNNGGGNGIFGALAVGAKALTSPDSLVGSAISNGLGAFIMFQAAKLVISVSLSTWKKHADWYAMQTGDYRQSVLAEDLQTSFNNLSSPISTLISNHRRRTQVAINDERKAMHLELLGDSVINSYINRGV